MFIEDRTKMYCPNCGEIMNAEDADTHYTPPHYDGVNGGDPAEWEIKCPYCGEELEVVDCFCEICGEPIVRNYDGYYESNGRYCDECEQIIADSFDAFITDLMDKLGVDKDTTIEAVGDYLERI